MTLALSHGIFPVVYYVLKEYNSLIPKNTLATMKFENMAIAKQNMLMTSELIKVMKILKENNIEVISFKGPVLSQMAYGDITLRQYCDLDILVKSGNLLEISELFKKNKFDTIDSVSLLKNDSYLNSDNDFSFFTTTNTHIELHWKLFREKIGKNLTYEEYFTQTQNININNSMIPTLSCEQLFVYLCLHGSKHGWERIEWIVDIYYLIELNKIDWTKLIEVSKKMHCEISLFLGLKLIKTFFYTKYPKNIDMLINNDLIKNLVSETISFLSNDFVLKEDYNKYQQINLYQLKLISNKKQKIEHIIFTYFSITRNDYLLFPLPKYLNFLHYLIKPFRVLSKMILKGK